MRKYLGILLVTIILFLSACSFPVNEKETGSEDTLGASTTPGGAETTNATTTTTDTLAEGTQKDTTPNTTSTTVNKLKVTLYYQDSEGDIIPVTRKLEKQEGVARAAVGGLIDSALNREKIEYFGVYPVLPEGTRILGINLKEGTATIDFSSELLNYDSEKAERGIVASVVYTLTEFKTIDNVRILVDGKAQKQLKFHTDISEDLNRENVLINEQRVNLPEGNKKVDVYLFKDISEKFTYLLPVSIAVENMVEDDLTDTIVDQLSKDYKDQKLYSAIPVGTALMDSSVEGNVLELDFNKTLVSYGGGHAMEDGILQQILHSMKGQGSIETVRILVDGKTPMLPEGSDVSKAMAIPTIINDFIDSTEN